MGGWRVHKGEAIALDRENVDTDQLIPARFMSTPRDAGYGEFLLHDLRFDASGEARPDLSLNRHPGASVLVSRRNFGSGSSREAAVYALVDFGVRVVVAPSFGDIFASNAVNNGLLPARVADTDGLIDALSHGPLSANVDLGRKTIAVGDSILPFDIAETWREKLINGWDDIDLTRAHRSEIASYRSARQQKTPWAFPMDRNDT